MLVSVQSNKRLNRIALPEIVGGARWISDGTGGRIAFVDGRDGNWRLEPAEGYTISGAKSSTRYLDIEPRRLTVVNLKASNGKLWSLGFYPDDETAIETAVYVFNGAISFVIGRGSGSDIVYSNGLVSDPHLRLEYDGRSWRAMDLESTNGTFLNGAVLEPGQSIPLAFGDIVDVMGFRITFGRGFISCNNPVSLSSDGSVKPLVKIKSRRFNRYRAPAIQPVADKGKTPERVFFYPALRFARSIEKKTFAIDAPPQKEREDKTPLLMRIGPSIFMGLASLLSACVFISMMAEQNASILRAVPMIAMAVAMLAGSVIWPIVSDKHQKKERAENEDLRQSVYSKYFAEEMSRIDAECELQRAILLENRISVVKCLEMAERGDIHLMDRTSLHEDYLELRIGLGSEPLQAEIRFPESHFTVEEDQFRANIEAKVFAPRTIDGVPQAISLIEDHIIGIIGEPESAHSFTRGLTVQIAALCSYEDVKIVLFCDEATRGEWEFMTHVPHCFSNDKKLRFFACGLEEVNGIGMHLERMLDAREGNQRFVAREAKPYYVVICASSSISARASIVRSIVDRRGNMGVSFVAIAPDMNSLPKECRSVVEVKDGGGHLLNRDDPTGGRKQFTPDIFVSRVDAERFAYNIARISLEIASESKGLPDKLGFLEMLEAGNAGHLNIAARWKESNASATLACRVGMDSQGQPFYLDLNDGDKAHGPHGLIAGMTGSGKSEFLITYILSMAVQYSPEDVAFLIIDYKGGGLAKTFDNEHVRLPHLAGVITNLDGAAITRSLASIRSELRRRQMMFNKALDIAGGDTMNIGKYLNLYRRKRAMDDNDELGRKMAELEPCPHLIIIADEFAELKQQQPEFMDELISTARIGRSLGVHLVLATQKPSGVVNDQIWSNARFKVSLKVADAADSNEMLRRPDAAELREAGRFYLLVGYNEYFALGQSGYAGTRYVAKDRYEKTRDNTVVLISDTGSPVVSVSSQIASSMVDERSEAMVVLAAISEVSELTGLRASRLWMDPLSPDMTVESVMQKYRLCQSVEKGQPFLTAVVGMFDDPSRQSQGPLLLDLLNGGHVLVYGTKDSGAEAALNAAAYSLLRGHDASMLHMYILDFGSGALGAFASAPQVGDVVGIGDDEKVGRFFGFIENLISERRKKLAPYGGSFARYRAGRNDLPAVVVLINDLAAFNDAYPIYEERISKLAHDASLGGVFLVATAPGPSSVYLKVRQHFGRILAVNLTGPGDYGLALETSTVGIPQPHGFGRGLAKVAVGNEENLFEIQIAKTTEGESIYDSMRAFSNRMLEAAGGLNVDAAQPVPVAPAQVSVEALAGLNADADTVPFGVFDDDLSVAGFDYSDSPIARAHYQNKKSGSAFLRAFVATTAARSEWAVALLDMARAYGTEHPAGCDFATRQDEHAKSYLESLFDTSSGGSASRTTLLVITGVADFINRNGIEFAAQMKTFLQDVPVDKGIRILLVDSVSNASYNYDDWFKANLTNRDGLWIGKGVESQTLISTAYNAKFISDSEMDSTKGYMIDGGATRLVHLVSCD